MSTPMLIIAAWQMYDITHGADDLGQVGLAQFLPAFALCLVVGHVADRHDQRRILMHLSDRAMQRGAHIDRRCSKAADLNAT